MSGYRIPTRQQIEAVLREHYHQEDECFDFDAATTDLLALMEQAQRKETG